MAAYGYDTVAVYLGLGKYLMNPGNTKPTTRIITKLPSLLKIMLLTHKIN